MDTTSIVILAILAFLAILGVILIGLGVIVYRQQSHIKKQNQQIQRLRQIVKKERSVEVPAVRAPITTPPTHIISDNAPVVVQQISPRVKAEPSGIVPVVSHSFAEPDPSPARPPVNTELVLTEEFKRGLELLNGDAPCIFVTGKAGTGKSRLLTHFVETTNKVVVLLAPTGMAALRINGQTIHSFFGFPPRALSEEDIKPSSKRELYRALDTIVIDEISMVRTDMLDAIDQFLRLNGKDGEKPFGGIQMVFFGDLYQLPPIIADEDESKYLASNYNGSFFFDAHVMRQLPMEKLELTKVFRQKDAEFVRALNTVRIDEANQEMLDYLNQRHAPVRSKDRNTFVTLVTTNKSADLINSQELGKIPSPSFTYTAQLEGEFKKENWKKKMPADLELTLKVNARVIFIKNDAGKRWLNGDHGKIIELGENHIRAEMEREGEKYVYEVTRETWEIIKYRFDPTTLKIKPEVTGKFTQYPLRLGWAITIHKSQGATLERVHVDMGSGAFAAGQAYVALSRCKSLDGMTLERPILLSDVKSDPTVKRFMAFAFPDEETSYGAPPALTEAAETVSKKARSRSDLNIDEDFKYGTGKQETPGWYVDKTVDMVLPLLFKRDTGVDLKTYRGSIKVYVNSIYHWTSTISDEKSMQAAWQATRGIYYVSVLPLNDFDAVKIDIFPSS